jgi:hypothetical protein
VALGSASLNMPSPNMPSLNMQRRHVRSVLDRRRLGVYRCWLCASHSQKGQA